MAIIFFLLQLSSPLLLLPVLDRWASSQREGARKCQKSGTKTLTPPSSFAIRRRLFGLGKNEKADRFRRFKRLKGRVYKVPSRPDKLIVLDESPFYPGGSFGTLGCLTHVTVRFCSWKRSVNVFWWEAGGILYCYCKNVKKIL